MLLGMVVYSIISVYTSCTRPSGRNVGASTSFLFMVGGHSYDVSIAHQWSPQYPSNLAIRQSSKILEYHP